MYVFPTRFGLTISLVASEHAMLISSDYSFHDVSVLRHRTNPTKKKKKSTMTVNPTKSNPTTTNPSSLSSVIINDYYNSIPPSPFLFNTTIAGSLSSSAGRRTSSLLVPQHGGFNHENENLNSMERILVILDEVLALIDGTESPKQDFPRGQ